MLTLLFALRIHSFAVRGFDYSHPILKKTLTPSNLGPEIHTFAIHIQINWNLTPSNIEGNL